MFDHTLLLQHNDPELARIQSGVGKYAKIQMVDSVSAEGLAKMVYEYIQLRPEVGHVLEYVTVEEDSKNSATYHGQ